MNNKNDIITQYCRITNLLQPSAKSKLRLAVEAFNENIRLQKEEDPHDIAIAALKEHFNDPLNIDVLVHLVMFEVWYSEEEELRQLIGEMRRMNELKKKQRELIENLKKKINQSEEELDTLGALSEEMSLKLQVAMDRRAKIAQTLSNILKKVSSTADSIIQNIK